MGIPDRINVLWFLPTHGDSRYLGTGEGGRAVDLPYLTPGRAGRRRPSAIYGVLLPTGRSCEDSWVVASALAPFTKQLASSSRSGPACSPRPLAARMTATLDRLSNGRLLINVVTGGDPVENGGDGIFLDHAERYEVTREFLDIYKRVLAARPSTSAASTSGIEDGTPALPAGAEPLPAALLRRLLGGRERRRRRADRQVPDLGRAAGRRGRPSSTPSGALAEQGRPRGQLRHPPPRHRPRDRRGGLGRADRLISKLDDDHHRRRAEGLRRAWTRSASADEPRCTAAAATSSRSAPTCGPASASSAAAPAPRWSATPTPSPSGSTSTAAIGIDTFILSGYPHLEEAYSFGELVLPNLPLGHPLPGRSTAVNMGPFGETVAGDHRPQAAPRPSLAASQS